MYNPDGSYDLRLFNSSSLIVSGPTQSGKTTFILNMLEHANEMFQNPISKIYWISNTLPAIRKPNFHYMVGLPDEFDFVQSNAVLVIDDLMSESLNNAAITNLFTRVAHHQNVFVIFVTQNYFSQCKQGTTRRRNVHYLALFKNPADMSEIRNVGSKMYPGDPKFLPSVYNDATKFPHGYLFIDYRQETANELRVRTKTLPHELPMATYKQK